jgi:hypothetical protein
MVVHAMPELRKLSQEDPDFEVNLGYIALEMKEGSEWRWLIRQHRIYCGEVVLWRESPARELEPSAAYRLGVFMRWVEKPQDDHWVG